MINYDYITKNKLEEHNPNCLQISDHPYRIVVIREIRSRKKLVNTK